MWFRTRRFYETDVPVAERRGRTFRFSVSADPPGCSEKSLLAIGVGARENNCDLRLMAAPRTRITRRVHSPASGRDNEWKKKPKSFTPPAVLKRGGGVFGKKTFFLKTLDKTVPHPSFRPVRGRYRIAAITAGLITRTHVYIKRKKY